MAIRRGGIWLLFSLLVALAFLLVLGLSNHHSESLLSAEFHENESTPVVSNVAEGSQSNAKPLDVSNVKQVSEIDQSYEPIAGNAKGVIAALQPRAQNGDTQAAFDLYLKLNSCFYETRGGLVANNIYEQAGVARSAAESTEQALIDCEGLSASDYGSRGEWLTKAADSGMVEAQLLFASDASAILGDSSDMLADPDKVKRYRRKAMEYLHRAANKGNVNALMQISNAYRRGILTDPDLVSSYAYYRAAQRASSGLQASDRMQRRYEEQLTAPEVIRSKLLADSIYRKCCQ